MATHSSILAWRIPLSEEPGVLQSIGLHRVWHNCVVSTHTLIIYQDCVLSHYRFPHHSIPDKQHEVERYSLRPWNWALRAWVLSLFSCVWLFVTPWTVTHQALLSMRFSRQEYWSGLPFPPPEDLPHLGMEPTSLLSPALAGGLFTTRATWGAWKWALHWKLDHLGMYLIILCLTLLKSIERWEPVHGINREQKD